MKMYFFYIIVSFFALIGVFFTVKEIAISFLRIKENSYSTNLLITIKDDKSGDIDLETKIALSRLKWYNIKRYDNVFIVGCGLSLESFKVCEDHCRNADIKLMDKSEFSKIINSVGKGNDGRKSE